MFRGINLKNILFLDIETVPLYQDFSMLSALEQELFQTKIRRQISDDITVDELYQRAGIWAEFGKIICISVGYFFLKKDQRNFRITSFYGDEKAILEDFSNLVNKHFSQTEHLFCGHNIKEFDIPYIARRMLINGLTLPDKLQLFGKKPWEVPHLDTLELWKFGDYKHYISLRLLSNILAVASPKEDIDGSMVGEIYYKDKDIERIVDYCQGDVITVAQILLRLKGETLLEQDEISVL
ncbi:MAG: 3'-5' exonuclease [Bacteroidota bacterium]|nr:3'-5' exonuclease [Bacteroidota bacterium]